MLPLWRTGFSIRGRRPIDTAIIHWTALSDPEQLEIVERDHKNIYPKSTISDSHICYHYFIGSDATLVTNRALTERPYCTRDIPMNERAVHIVLAGSPDSPPNSKQIRALKGLLVNLNHAYRLKRIIGHKQANSPTQCPGDKVSDWLKGVNINPVHAAAPEKKFVLSRYYTPVRGQPEYYRDTYEQDFVVNCLGDCLSTASTYRLTHKDAYKVVACPAKYPFGTKFIINDQTFTCWDRGGAIKEDGQTIRLDLWAGIGMTGLKNIRTIGVPHNPVVEVILP